MAPVYVAVEVVAVAVDFVVVAVDFVDGEADVVAVAVGVGGAVDGWGEPEMMGLMMMGLMRVGRG